MFVCAQSLKLFDVQLEELVWKKNVSLFFFSINKERKINCTRLNRWLGVSMREIDRRVEPSNLSDRIWPFKSLQESQKWSGTRIYSSPVNALRNLGLKLGNLYSNPFQTLSEQYNIHVYTKFASNFFPPPPFFFQIQLGFSSNSSWTIVVFQIKTSNLCYYFFNVRFRHIEIGNSWSAGRDSSLKPKERSFGWRHEREAIRTRSKVAIVEK